MSENKYIIEVSEKDCKTKQIFNLKNNNSTISTFIRSREEAESFIADFSEDENDKYRINDVVKLICGLVEYYLEKNCYKSTDNIINIFLKNGLNINYKIDIFYSIIHKYIEKNKQEYVEKIINLIVFYLDNNIENIDKFRIENIIKILNLSVGVFLKNNNLNALERLIIRATPDEDIRLDYKNIFIKNITQIFINAEKIDEFNKILFNIIDNGTVDNSCKINLLRNVIGQFEENSLNNSKWIINDIFNCNLDDNDKIYLLNFIVNEFSKKYEHYSIKNVLYFIFNSKTLDEFSKSYIINSLFEINIETNNNDDFVENLLKINLNSSISDIFKIGIVRYSMKLCIQYRKYEDIEKVGNSILDSNFDYKNKIKILNETIKNIELEIKKSENHNEILDNLVEILNFFNELKSTIIINKQEEIIYSLKNKNQQSSKEFLLEQLEVIINNRQQINNKIKPLENAEKNIVSHITDTHGDSLAVLGALKQTGFIGDITGEMLFYNIYDKKFYKLADLYKYNYDIEKIKKYFVIIPDFKLPDKIPKGVFVHTGDIQDRGQESAESFVILRRLIDMYTEYYMQQGLDKNEAKEKAINKIVITTSDHDDYTTSRINEDSIEEFLGISDIYNNFDKQHKVQEDMFLDGYINSGRLIQTNNRNLKIFVNHSYIDANSVVLVLMAIIFPYRKFDYIYNRLDVKINLDYILKLKKIFKKLIASEKYKNYNIIFNKIKVNIIKYVLKKENDLDNINESLINAAQDKLYEHFVKNKLKLNGIFKVLRKSMGIPTNGEEFKGKEKLSVVEILEAFSIGNKAIDEMNREKMKETDNNKRHYDDPIISLITFRNGRTDRSSGKGGFVDSTNSRGLGISAKPLENLLEAGVVILSGHDVIIYDDKLGNWQEKAAENMENIRKMGNYTNDRKVSYALNIKAVKTEQSFKLDKESNLVTYTAAQVFKMDNDNKNIVNGVLNPLMIVRGKPLFKSYGESGLESQKIIDIFPIPEQKITEILGVGTEESVVNIPIKEDIIENNEDLSDGLNVIQDINVNEIDLDNSNVNSNVLDIKPSMRDAF